MAQTKQLPDLALGKSWPHKLLQVFPANWKREYLLRKSGGDSHSGSFDLVSPLKEASRFLIVWPEQPEEALIAFSALRALHSVIGREALYAHLCTENLSSLVGDLFQGDQILTWTRESLAWHENSIQTVSTSLKIFAPQVSVNLMQPCPTVIQALVKTSGAGLRIAVDPQMPWPYSNLRLQAAEDSALAARYFQILEPWRYAGFSPGTKWGALIPDEAQAHDAVSAWSAASVASDGNWIYLHDASNPARPLDDDLYSWLWERIHVRDSEEVGIVLAIINPNQNPNPKIFSPTGMWSAVPVLKIADFSELVSVAGLARGVAGFQGWGIHAASLADVACLAFLQREESAYDVSPWNKLFEVEWV